MKLLITSPGALIDDESGDFFPGIIDSLDSILAQSEFNKIVVISIHPKSLEKIPGRFNPVPIKWRYRGSPDLVNILKDKLKFDAQDVIILGAKKHDMYMASNTKSLLLRAVYAKLNNPDDIIYEKKYGIPIKDASVLTHFFTHFTNVSEPWYYNLEVDNTLTIYALTNANTMGNISATQKELNEKFKACLKAGVGTYRRQFMIYFLISTYAILKDLEKVNYWGIYPSSKIADNSDLNYFKEKARQTYNCKTGETIFERTAKTFKRSDKLRSQRLSDGCDSQLETIRINPYYKGKLKNKCVCIIDDFTTYGTSCETARALLEAAGVGKIIFIALGKFGSEYHRYDYSIQGDVYDEFQYEKINSESMDGNFNAHANFEFIQSLGDML